MSIVFRLRSLSFAMLCLALSGCQTMSWFGASTAVAPGATAEELPLTADREGSTLAEPNVQQAASFADKNSVASASSITPLSDQELQQSDEVLRELETIGADDPAAAQQLVKRLQGVKPSLRPLVAREFRTSWQFHRQKFSADKRAVASESASDSVHRQAPTTPHVASLPATQPSTATPTASPAIQPTTTIYPSAENVAPSSTKRTEFPGLNTHGSHSRGPMDMLGAGRLLASTVSNPYVQRASYEQSPTLMPMPAVATDGMPPQSGMQVDEPRDWQDALAGTIDQLARQSSSDPRNTLEAYEHVRLRLLQLAAGNKEQALEPIPGLTPTEQTYWSNQMFAIATLLEHDAMPDDQQRAALAREQLAEAQSRLGELSNLAARNLTFCEKVYGFGDYDRRQSSTFKPGESVTLYTEIDNFRSESTKKGYHTSLATSYEVLDQSGNRVEGGEFATVDDYCARKRNDFYIEYTIELPNRIYASKYQLRLLIRDRLSGKIGKSTVDFEIEE